MGEGLMAMGPIWGIGIGCGGMPMEMFPLIGAAGAKPMRGECFGEP